MTEPKRILVVDDHFRILDSVKSMLEASGREYEVIGVPSAEEGMLEIRRESVDLLITDIYLPGMSGAELIVRVNKRWPELPIIVITVHAEQMGPEEAASSGIVNYFEKPMEPVAFVAAVHSALDESSATEKESFLDGSQNIAQSQTLAVRFLVESLRADTESVEVLLGTRDGKIVYVTGGRGSALAVLAKSFSEAIDGMFHLADRMGSKNPDTIQFISDDQVELHFATQGGEYFIASLYHAGGRVLDIDLLWDHLGTTLAKTVSILHYKPEAGTVTQTEENLETESDDVSDELQELRLTTEATAIDTRTPERNTEAAENESLELPDIDESVDLDVFWEEALATELEEGDSRQGLDMEEAQKMGLIPPEFKSKK
jgi:DNA-binding response OmpR family regulator